MRKSQEEEISELEDRLIEIQDELDSTPPPVSQAVNQGEIARILDTTRASRRRELDEEQDRLQGALTKKLKALGWDEERIAAHLDELCG